MKITKSILLHSGIFALLSLSFLYILHHLTINQLFIDSFSEYIKNQDLMDITCSRFRDKNDPKLFDNRIFIINSGVTDRVKLASSLNILSRRNAKVVGVDLFFDSLRLDKSDTLLKEAVAQSENLIFANSFEQYKSFEDSADAINSHSYLIPQSKQYYVNLATDDGYTVRSFEPMHIINGIRLNSFAVAISSKFQPQVLEDLRIRNHQKEWINFRRTQFENKGRSGKESQSSLQAYPIINIDKFLKDSSLYDANYFADKIVLIGFCGDERENSLNDRYFTPLNMVYSGRSYPDMHGIVIHANIISMLLDHDYIDEIPEIIINIIAFIIFFINFIIFIVVSKARLFFNLVFIRIIQLIQFLLLFSMSIWLLASLNQKIGFVFIMTAVIISFELFEFYIHKLQDRLERLLTKLNISLSNQK